MPQALLPKIVVVVLIISGVGSVFLLWRVPWDEPMHSEIAGSAEHLARQDQVAKNSDTVLRNLEQRGGRFHLLYACDNAEDSSFALNADQDEKPETLLLCTGGLFPTFSFLYLLDDSDNDEHILWKTRVGESLKTATKPRILELDGDGVNEIFWTGQSHGGTCTSETSNFNLYAPIYDEEFYMIVERKWDTRCSNQIKQVEFSKNLENLEYLPYLRFLEDLQ